MNIEKIEHLGIAVKNLEKAVALYHGVLGMPIVDRETLGEMKLKVVKVQAGESVLELLEPLPGEQVISKFLATEGEGIHHVCFEVDDVAKATEHVRSQGYETVWPAPKKGAGGRLVMFLKPKQTGGVLIELNQPV